MGVMWVKSRLRALRAFSFPVSVLPVVIGAAAVRPVGQWQWDVLVVSLLGVVALHAAGNLLNDYFDFAKGVDTRRENDQGRPGRLLVRGELSRGEVLREAFFCGVLAAAVGVYLTLRCGAGIILFGMGAVMGLYVYTGPPFCLKYRALGEVVVFVVFGPLLVTGAAFAQTGSVELAALLFSVPVGFVTTAVLVGNNLRDQEEDRQARITTLTHVIGPHAGRLLYGVLVVSALAIVTVFGFVGWGGWALCFVPVLLVLVVRSLHSVLRGTRRPDIDVRTAKFETAFLVFLTVTLLLQGPAAITTRREKHSPTIEAAGPREDVLGKEEVSVEENRDRAGEDEP